jgi:methylene-fatty-acyl-phospholipid synthase
MWFSAQDATSLIGGLSLYLAAIRACGDLAHASLTQVPTLPFAIAAVGVSSSYVVYALVWFSTAAFVAECKRLPLRLLGSDPISVFQTLVLSFKLFQQLVLLGWVVRVVGGDRTVPSSWYPALKPLFLGFAADPPRIAVAMALLLAGQALNAGIYAAIGKEGVYYGFKLGASVPWVTGFPFNLGYRHPQYVGGTLSQYALFAVLSSPATQAAGLLPLLAWWTVNYALVSWMEASFGDNDKSQTTGKKGK